MNFELLCMDFDEMVTSKTLVTMLLAFQANDMLWSKQIVVNDNQIKYTDDSLLVSLYEYDTSKFVVGNRFISAYRLNVESEDYTVIEPIRMKLVDHLREMHFSHIRILHDDVSTQIACKLYPLFNHIENKLREFIVNALVKKIGPSFLQFVVDKETIDKSKNFKKNEPHFIACDKVVGDVTLLYFDALGKIVYGDVPVFTQSKDILKKVDSATSLEELKKDLLDGNFQKYFKDCFEKTDFKNKWTELNNLRNLVAHNSYFLDEQLTKCEKLIKELDTIIDKAYGKIDTLKLSIVDREALQNAYEENYETEVEKKQENLSSETDDKIYVDLDLKLFDCGKNEYRKISEEELIRALEKASEEMEFVGLKYFVKEVLGKDNYSYESSYTLINLLIDKGVLITEKVNNPNGIHDTTAIKLA